MVSNQPSHERYKDVKKQKNEAKLISGILKQDQTTTNVQNNAVSIGQFKTGPDLYCLNKIISVVFNILYVLSL